MREFVTAVDQQSKTAEEIEEGDTFPIHKTRTDPETGEVEVIHTQIIRYYKPSPGQYALLMADTGRHATPGEATGAVLNFFDSTLDRASARYIRDRLFDGQDTSFDLPQVTEIMEEMIAEWGGRPTKRPSDFKQSQKPGGQNSTLTTSPSTSSPSLLTGT